MLTSPSFREDGMKIGKSSRPVNVLSNELNNTVVSLPFEIYATLKTSKYDNGGIPRSPLVTFYLYS